MKKIKYIIVGLIFVIFIIIAMIYFFNSEKQEGQNNDEVSYLKDKKREVLKENNNSTFMLANELINKFFSCVFEENEFLDNKQMAYSVLDNDYKNKNNITKDNVNKILEEYIGYSGYITNEIYRVELADSGKIEDFLFLYIKGKVRVQGQVKHIYFFLKVDSLNSTYSIQLLEKEEYERLIKEDSEEENTDSIGKNSYNNLYTKTVTNYELCLMHIEDFSKAYENNVEEAFYLLEEDYRKSRFENVNDFKEYIDERKQVTYLEAFSEYMVNTYSDYTEYVCKDKYGYVYIFKEEIPMQYTLQLDTYTIPTDKFKEEYENGSEHKKVQMNIDKFILMINNQDYDAAYNVLADSFKNNYFPTKESFVQHIQQKLYRYNNLEISSFDKKGNTYICTALLSDLTNGLYKDSSKGTGGSGYQIGLNVVMQLGEGYNFKISFEVE